MAKINPNDARVIKTKAKLTEEFSRLLCDRKFEDINVNELCDRAGVRRATFYKHFSGKYGFLEYFVGHLRENFDRRYPMMQKKVSSPADYYTEYAVAIIDFITENEAMIQNALDSDMLPSLIQVIISRNFEDTQNRLRQTTDEGARLPASVEITASMMTSAVAGTIVWWLKSGKALPKDRLCAEISSVISAIVS